MLARLVLGTWVISLLNIVVGAITITAIIDVVELMLKAPDYTEAEDILQGINVILIGYGVMLEERDTLRRLAGIGGGPAGGTEETIDLHCHDAGVLLVVLGVFAEIALECIKIPDRIINTAQIEGAIVGLGVMIDCLVLGVLAVLVFQLVTIGFKSLARRPVQHD